MERNRRDCHGRTSRYRRITMILVCLILVLAVGVVGFKLTEAKDQKKAQKTNSKEVKKETKAENKDSENPEQNPLVLEQDSEVSKAVSEYFSTLTTDKDFVESYDNTQVYTKLGKYKDTYVAFVRYDMKIKDIYTKVPGMETLYVKQNPKSGNFKVNTGIADAELKNYISLVTEHEDVQNLMSEVESSYQNAVQSDALLREALQDLKNAYENADGTSS